MAYKFKTYPAHTVNPGTTIQSNGIVFSSVFRDCRSCGILLYHLPDCEEIRVPLTDEYRYGDLYSIRIEGLRPAEWAYRYYRDELTFEDPFARKLIEIETSEGKRWASQFYPYKEDELPAYGQGRRGEWADEVIYLLHVKGFTASKTSKVRNRGSFRGIISKIPYLKKLGVTSVEIMPMYELRPETMDVVVGVPQEMQENPERMNLSESGEPKEDHRKRKANYWNFGEGCYFAPKYAYSASGDPQMEFQEMVRQLHENGIGVILQLFFPDNVTIQTQVETARFYVTHYQVDGFHLKGSDKALNTLATDPMLADTALFYYGFPYAELTKQDEENPTMVGTPSIRHLCEYNDSYQWEIRQFVKSDNNVLREFMKRFVDVPMGHGRVHYAASYEGFTLYDLVSYNWKHNAANGEDNRDGNDTNYSWNCGYEGHTQKKDIKRLRLRQMKNFMLLNYLSQGTPLIHMGDERCNSQNGNNNPYCQDNETGWLNWKDTKDSREMLAFTQDIAQFRRDHAVFRRRTPFRFNDYKVVGFPDISFHGKEAWKPDLTGYSHTIGVLLPEQYDEVNPQESLLYLAINMHWHTQSLGIPSIPDGWRWRAIIDTGAEQSFIADPQLIEDQKHVDVPGRSIVVLRAVREFDPEVERKRLAAERKKAEAAERRAQKAAQKAAAKAEEAAQKAAAEAQKAADAAQKKANAERARAINARIKKNAQKAEHPVAIVGTLYE